MAKPIFKWSGEYIGFIHNGRFFDNNSNYLGWIENDGSVWNSDGRYFGELIENSYILRNSMKLEPLQRLPKLLPLSPLPLLPSLPRLPKLPKLGWVDAFD